MDLLLNLSKTLMELKRYLGRTCVVRLTEKNVCTLSNVPGLNQ